MRIETFKEDSYASADELHRDIAERLSFPDYYGANFAALSDCLEDIDEETVIVCDRGQSGHEFFEKFVTVCERCALDNPELVVRVIEGGKPIRPCSCPREYAEAGTEDE